MTGAANDGAPAAPPAILEPGAERWPVLTRDVPAVPGAIKRFYEDFVVEEVPRYAPEGRGDHVFFTIEKAGLTTHKA
ncbi:MAG TPA: tRNA pseudouridine(13) synthase TruD, partial [Longimicrobiales bacterium]